MKHSLHIVRSKKMCVRVLILLEVNMKTLKMLLDYFSKGELILWSGSVFAVILSFCLFDRNNYLTLLASLIGVTSLIYNAKGNPFGQFLMIIFSLLYGVISFTFAYYGEMLTYLGMTMPMAVFALISWMKNPYNGNKAEVKINHLSRGEIKFMWILAAFITAVFYFILTYFHTANIIPSTISVTTSFVAVYLTFRRSPYYAVGYAANDVVLIVLWVMATFKDISYSSVVVCFIAFLVNDVYGFINWCRMGKRQMDKL
jgi:nicotinamide mononucleotide transporter